MRSCYVYGDAGPCSRAGVIAVARKSAFEVPGGRGDQFFGRSFVSAVNGRAYCLKSSRCFPRETSFFPVVAWNVRRLELHPPPRAVRTLKVGVRALGVVCAEKRGKQCKKVRDVDVRVYQTRFTGTVATVGH